MSEITKEYFDSAVSNLATKSDLESIRVDLSATEEKLIKRMDELLTATETGLAKRIDASQEELARMTARGFDDVLKRLDVRSKVEQLEQQMHEVRQELNLA
ncbi:MAG TPA: hypothetical protein VMZ27_02635 [Candidatus Saccharimonadales bacterium]|nr:hypothetical protein [Candidatus Saccharimonadales bacterium]